MVCLAAVSLVIFTHRTVLQHGVPSKLVTGHLHTQESITTWSFSHTGQYYNMVCPVSLSLVIFTHWAVPQHGMAVSLSLVIFTHRAVLKLAQLCYLLQWFQTLNFNKNSYNEQIWFNAALYLLINYWQWSLQKSLCYHWSNGQHWTRYSWILITAFLPLCTLSSSPNFPDSNQHWINICSTVFYFQCVVSTVRSHLKDAQITFYK